MASAESDYSAGGPRHYRCMTGALFVRRSADPSQGAIVKVTRRGEDGGGGVVAATGSQWTGPQGGVWAELDETRGEKPGWVLVRGPGFGLSGPALVGLPEPEPAAAAVAAAAATATTPPAVGRAEAKEAGAAEAGAAEAGAAEAGAAEAGPPCSVYAMSDLHTDYPQNMELLREMPAYHDDAVIAAGDISHQLPVVRETLEILKSKFKHVFFCPGNHDLWLHKDDGCKDSLEKLAKLQAMCDDLGVHTKPRSVGGSVTVVPLLSWYEPLFDSDPDVDDDSFLPVEQTMTDFHLCKWPAGFSPSNSSLASHFDQLNDQAPQIQGTDNVVISFSHFLPRPELLPEKRYLFYPNLPKAAGSRALGARVSRLRPQCHVFGHSHYGWDGEVDGVRYLQAAVAYPTERKARGFALRLREGDSNFVRGDVDGGITSPILVYDACCQELPRWSGFWSGYYARYARRPSDVRWLYRKPRVKADVGKVLKVLVDGGKEVEDDVVESLLPPSRARVNGY